MATVSKVIYYSTWSLSGWYTRLLASPRPPVISSAHTSSSSFSLCLVVLLLLLLPRLLFLLLPHLLLLLLLLLLACHHQHDLVASSVPELLIVFHSLRPFIHLGNGAGESSEPVEKTATRRSCLLARRGVTGKTGKMVDPAFSHFTSQKEEDA